MPNWCECTLKITADSLNKLEKFYNENKDENMELSFNKNVPLPDEESENWYNWRIANWGTKWDLGDETSYDVSNEENEKVCIYIFCTAWGPPINWLTTVSSIYSDIKFKLDYCEPGMNFAGNIIIQNQEILSDEEYSSGYYYWCQQKEDILSGLVDYIKTKDEIKNAFENLKKTKLSIITKIFDLPEDINSNLLNYSVSQGQVIYNFIKNNKDIINTILEDEFYIYDSSIFDNQILPAVKNYILESSL